MAVPTASPPPTSGAGRTPFCTHTPRTVRGRSSSSPPGTSSRILAARALGLAAEQGRLFASTPASVSVIEDHHGERCIGLWNLDPALISHPGDRSASTHVPRDQAPAPAAAEVAARAVRSVGLPAGTAACLFDLDGVLTETATVHAAGPRTALCRDSRTLRPG
ncbi:MAG: hypothetical protein WAW17_01330 [Rhodococcus sp. (in: high G+C Gram-positive bacteria)]